MSITHGSSQLRTCRKASGQDREARSSSAPPFFPRLCAYGLVLRCWRICECCLLLADIRPPAEAEGAEDQLPMPSDGAVASDLEVSEAQLSLDLPVALLYPLPEAVDSYHLRQIGRLQRGCLCPAGVRGGQVSHQVPRAVGRQRLRVRTHRH